MQDLRLHLTGADNGGGRINADRSSMSITVRPRSNPCGTVSFASSIYTVAEPVNQLTQYVRLVRAYVVLSGLSFTSSATYVTV